MNNEKEKTTSDEAESEVRFEARVMRFLRWLFVNGAFMALLIYAIYWKVQWANNLIIFATWSLTILGLLVISVDSILTSIQKDRKIRSVPLWLDQTSDVILICILAANGWYWTAAIWILQMGVVAKIYEQKHA